MMIHVDPPPGISAGDDPCGRVYLRFAKRERHTRGSKDDEE